MAGIRDTPLPGAGSSAWYPHYAAMDNTVRALVQSGFYLDEYTGTDQQKLDAAIADTKIATDRNMPAIVLPSRPMTMTVPEQIFSGLKLVSPSYFDGQKNPEINGGAYSGPEITFAGSIGLGTSSWWSSPGADTHDVIFANFQVQGSQGSAIHQFLDYAGGGSMYPCSFHSISGNFLAGMIGSSTRKALFTQATFTGDWTINNCWGTALNIGGSDMLIAPSMMNIGVTSSPVQTGDINRWFLRFDTAEIDIQGKIYVSTENGWRGLLITGASNISMNGGVYEGYKATRVNGLLSGPGPGAQIKIDSTASGYPSVTMTNVKIGQGMDNPDVSENGLVQINAGEVSMTGCQFYGYNMGSQNAVNHVGGRLFMAGITRRGSTAEQSNWSGRPRVHTTASVGSGAYTFYNPDQSVLVV